MIKSGTGKPPMTDLKRYFTTGLLALLPIAASVWVIVWLFRWVMDALLAPFFRAQWLAQLLAMLPDILLPWVQGLIGLIVIFVAISALGMLATNVAGRWFLGLVDKFMKRVPLANTVYSFVQGLIDNLNILSAGYFKRVVLIEYPRKGVWSVGFVSRDLTGNIQNAVPGHHMAVFVPTSPNPTSGFIIVAESSEVLPLDITPEQALKFIVSGGVLMPGAKVEAGPAPGSSGVV
jgi:uncharacterized membrane protein